MFRYNKIKIFILLFFDLFFAIGLIALFIRVKEQEILSFLIIPVILTIFLVKYMLVNLATAKYEDAMNKKDYDLADAILTKYERKYPWFKVLKVNLLLIKGEADLYIYSYNNLESNLDKKAHRYFYYLLETYKIYYDLICGNTVDFTKVNSIEGISETYAPKVCCEAIANLHDGKAQEAYDKVKQVCNQPSGDFSKFVYAYIQYLAAKELGLDLEIYKNAILKLAYNDFLKQCFQRLTR